jgi:hypothetical protein
MKFLLTLLLAKLLLLLSFVYPKDLLFVENASEKVKVCKQIRNNKTLKIKENFKNSDRLNSKNIILFFKK